MLTLTQLGAKADLLDAKAEKRVPLDAKHTPGDAQYLLVIDQPGSYYLTGNLGVPATKSNGIHVTAEGVTIDLNGFQLSRASGSGGDGIAVEPAAHGCTIKNGSVTGFASGVRAVTYGPGYAQGGALLQVSFTQCTSTGAFIGEGWRVDNCRAYKNSGTGFHAQSGSILTNCTATENGALGMAVAGNAIVINCVSKENTGPGIRLLGSGSQILNSTFNSNGVGTGVGAGIEVSQIARRCRVQNNTCNGNDKGITVASTENLIEGNHIRENSGFGIEVMVANGRNVIIRNEAGNNGGSYSAIAAGNQMAPTGDPSTSTNPFLNILN
jgi:parallel beta-helix repeat protein